MIDYKYNFSEIEREIDIDKIGLNDIIKIIDDLSTDEFVGKNNSKSFSADSITYLYSGKIDFDNISISAGIIANSFDNTRTIDKSVVGHFLSSINSNFLKLLKKADETLNADIVNRENQSGENNPTRDESAIIKPDTKRETVASSVTVKDVSEEKLGNILQIAVVSREEFSIEQEQVKGQEEVKGQEQIKGQEPIKEREEVKEQEQTKGPELAKGRMSMASWKAQIAQMKANEESSKKQPSLKIKEVGRDR